METIPGSYPADTPIPTPQATPQQEPNMLSQPPSNHHGILGHHDHPERNKLHKPGDPRGHKQADSGVDFGAMSSEPIQSKSEEPRTLPIPETVGGGTYATEGSLPSEKIGGERRESDSPPSQRDLAYTYARPGGDATDDQPPEMQRTSSKDIDPKRSSSDSSPPYWGSLPKAVGGGIYNTVMGHGSPRDDHAQHHKLPQRGGVYNTVAGHGSHDEESKRHGSQDASFIAPLPEIEEDKPLQLEDTDVGRSSFAGGGFLPVNEEVDPSRGSSVKIIDEAPVGTSGTTTRSTSHAESGPRAFPLVTDHDRLASLQEPTETRDVSESESRTRDSTLVGAAAAGAGAAMLASEKDKPNKLKKRQGSPTEATRGRQEGEHAEDKVIGSSLPHRPKEQRESSRSKRGSSRSKSTSEEGSHSPSGKKHSILGIFHRRKGSKGEAEEPNQGDFEHHSHRKEEGAAAAAAAAGTHGLIHHHNEKNKDQRSTSEPVASHSDRQPTKRMSANDARADARPSGQRMSGNESASAALAESGGAFSVLYHKPAEEEYRGATSGRSSDANAPAVPSKSEKRRSYSPRSSAALVEGSQFQDQNLEPARGSRESGDSQVSPLDTPKRSGSEATKYAAATAGIGASLFARDQNPSTDSRTGVPAFEHPREPPSTPYNASQSVSSRSGRRSEPSPKTIPVRRSQEVTVEPGHYNSLPSGTPSGVKPGPITSSREGSRDEEYNHLGSGTASGLKSDVASAMHSADRSVAKGSLTGESQNEEYNHLGSGTASGVKTDTIGTAKQQTFGSTDATSYDPEASEEEYNVLPSGTPSGVKIKPRSQRASFAEGTDAHHASRTGDGQYNTLASGVHSGVDAQQHDSLGQPQNEMQAARHTLIAAPMPMPSLGDSSPQVIPQEEGTRAYPPPEQAQEMSPAVLPDSYRTQSHAVPSAGPTESTASKTSTSSSNYSEPEYTTQLTDPALAAATGAWAAKAGASSGAPDRAKVLHRCEHCGKDNDITSQFTRENMAKATNKPGSTGNWWQSAWTSA